MDRFAFAAIPKPNVEQVNTPWFERGREGQVLDLARCEWTETFGSERLTGALLDRLTRHVSILEMNSESYRLANSTAGKQR